jgi:hypothetical protein
MFLVMLSSALSTWSLLCDGRHIFVVVILFQFPACLRVHSVEGVNGELRLLTSGVSSEEITEKNFHAEKRLRCPGMGQALGALYPRQFNL